jgi:glutathione synthase/RimK-type ligase-like ATP-grasp enzyme
MNLTAAFLISPQTNNNDNLARLTEALRAGGWDVNVFDHEQISMINAEVYLGTHLANQFDLIWPLGFGPRSSFSDRLQMLHLLNPDKLINRPDAYTWAHGKAAWLGFAPLSMVSNQPDQLIAFMQTNGGEWVLKPAAGSFGENVQRIESAANISAALHTSPGYWILQRFIPEIRQGETRTLICGDEILGSYLRVPTNQLHANLAQQGQACAAAIDQSTHTLIDNVHQLLLDAGVGFAAIDTVGGYLMEVNVANPGGLASLAEIYGESFTKDMYTRLTQALARRLV